MRFMVIRKADPDTEAGKAPGPELLAAMGAYMEGLVKSGHLLDGMGLHPSTRGARLSFNDGQATVLDGPFAETKELVAGVSILQADSLAEVVELLKGWPREDGDVVLEVRQVYELEELGPPEWADGMRAAGVG